MPDLNFGRSRYFRPVCIRYPYGFYGGPSGYEETEDPHAATLIIEAVKRGDLTLSEARDRMDWRENQ